MSIIVRPDHASKQVLFDISTVEKSHGAAIRHALFETGKHLKDDARSRINNRGRTGNIYQFNGRVHQASAEGEAPANLTGALRNSVDYSVRGKRQVEFGYKVEHGEWLENGSRFIKQRPNLETVSDDNITYFMRSLVRHFNDGGRS